MDRRKKKTQQAIKEAFIELALKNEISKITVTDIALRADISRKTFYLNYRDIYDVLDQLLLDMQERLEEIIHKSNFEQLKSDPFPIFEIIGDELEKHPLLEKLILDSSTSNMIIRRLKLVFINELLSQYQSNHASVPKLFPYSIMFIISGVVDIYSDWYRGNRMIEQRELTSHLSKLISQGVSSIY